MGYGSEECIECYCRHHSNNPEDVVPRNICRGCFLLHCPKGLTGRARCQICVRVGEEERCDCCGLEGVACLCEVAVCGRCLRDYWPAGAYNAENHEREAKEVDRDYRGVFYGFISHEEGKQWLWDLFCRRR